VHLHQIPARSYDVVTSIDVVEHVEDPTEFISQLARICRAGFFVTTPNWTASRCTWPYHLREYTPRELVGLLQGQGEVTLFKGTSSGSNVFDVRHRGAYYLFNDLRAWPLTSHAARCVNWVVPSSCKIQSHNAGWVVPR
jgi:2-polyprenyl-3-methyl-5-hydroxy-6-metoxy-1,4-benzoquinol methylase